MKKWILKIYCAEKSDSSTIKKSDIFSRPHLIFHFLQCKEKWYFRYFKHKKSDISSRPHLLFRSFLCRKSSFLYWKSSFLPTEISDFCVENSLFSNNFFLIFHSNSVLLWMHIYLIPIFYTYKYHGCICTINIFIYHDCINVVTIYKEQKISYSQSSPSTGIFPKVDIWHVFESKANKKKNSKKEIK